MKPSQRPRHVSSFQVASWGLGMLLSGYLLIRGSSGWSLLLLGRLVFYCGLLVSVSAVLLWLREAGAREDEEELPEEELAEESEDEP